MRILIVDDSDLALGLLETALRNAGHEVDQARNGAEALEWLRKGLHRLVISDLEMPVMDGLALCREVRATSVDYIYFMLLTAHNNTADIVEGLSAGADEFIAKPFSSAELLLRVRTGERLLSLESRDVAIFAMAKMAESRDKDTGQHLERVRSYSQMLSRQLMLHSAYRNEIDDSFVRLIYETSPLHDIGKVGIPDRILLKPGKLTPDEFEVMKSHTVLGKETLVAALEKYPEAKFLRFACDIVAYHHERFDGTGYPCRLKGHAIPLCARIVALADVYDALTSKRVYKEAMSHEEATQIIMREADRHFDAEIVEAFLAIADKFAEISRDWGDCEPTVSLSSAHADTGCDAFAGTLARQQ